MRGRQRFKKLSATAAAAGQAAAELRGWGTLRLRPAVRCSRLTTPHRPRCSGGPGRRRRRRQGSLGQQQHPAADTGSTKQAHS